MPEITIRDATAADRGFIADLGKRVLASSLSSLRPAAPGRAEYSYDRLLDIVDQQSHITFIAQLDAAPAGFLLMLDEMPDEVTLMPQGFIAYMAVEPSLERQGVATKLLDAAQDEARRRGLPYMSLMVTDENLAARALYERAGFVTERRLLIKQL